MNIISNSCVGSRIYELIGEKFCNPFMWNVITYDDFSKLIINYDKINFNNFKTTTFITRKDEIAQTIFDDIVKVYYIHYHQSKSHNRPTKINIDIHYNDIISYANEKIKKRVNRLLANKEEPIFIFETRDRPRFNALYGDDAINNFIHLKTPYKKILITSNEKYKNEKEIIDECYILYYNDERPDLPPDTIKMSKEVYNKFKKLFTK